MKRSQWITAAALLCAASGAGAQNALIDYQGYAWETGGFPVSNAGDVLSIVGIVDALDSRFGINLALEEVTLHASGLTSTGQVDLGGGLLSIAYNGGTIELYRDPSLDHDFGVNPPNPTAPPTFVNGSLLLGGTLDSFFMFYDSATGSGAFEANASFTAGSGLTTLNQLQANGYTFGGTLDTGASGGNVPLGYDLQVDGVIEVEVIVGVQQKNWSQIKSLYSR